MHDGRHHHFGGEGLHDVVLVDERRLHGEEVGRGDLFQRSGCRRVSREGVSCRVRFLARGQARNAGVLRQLLDDVVVGLRRQPAQGLRSAECHIVVRQQIGVGLLPNDVFEGEEVHDDAHGIIVVERRRHVDRGTLAEVHLRLDGRVDPDDAGHILGAETRNAVCPRIVREEFTEDHRGPLDFGQVGRRFDEVHRVETRCELFETVQGLVSRTGGTAVDVEVHAPDSGAEAAVFGGEIGELAQEVHARILSGFVRVHFPYCRRESHGFGESVFAGVVTKILVDGFSFHSGTELNVGFT